MNNTGEGVRDLNDATDDDVFKILPTVMVYLVTEDGEKKLTRALVDGGSEMSLIKQDFADACKLRGPHRSVTMSVAGGKEHTFACKRVGYKVQSLDGSFTSGPQEGFTHPVVGPIASELPFTQDAFPHLKDLHFTERLPRETTPVALLIGQPLASSIQAGATINGPGENQPMVLPTQLGNILTGSFKVKDVKGCLRKNKRERRRHSQESQQFGPLIVVTQHDAEGEPPTYAQACDDADGIQDEVEQIVHPARRHHGQNFQVFSSYLVSDVPAKVASYKGKGKAKPQVDLSDFWKLEHLGVTEDKNTNTFAEAKAVQLMRDQTFYVPEEKRWYTRLLWKDEPERLESNYNKAYAVMASMEKRAIKFGYVDQINDAYNALINSEFSEPVPRAEISDVDKIYYLETHAVFKDKEGTTKVRLVMNASSKSALDGLSLNQLLYQGPDYLPQLVHVLLRFRADVHVVALDIRSLF